MKKILFFSVVVGIFISPAFSYGADVFNFTTSTAGEVTNPGGYSSVFALGHPLMDIPTSTDLYFQVSGAFAGETCGDIGNSTRVWTLYEFADSGYSSYLNSADFAHRSFTGEWAIDNVIASTTDMEIASTTFSFAINSSSYYLIASYCGSGSGSANTLASGGSYGGSGTGIASWFGAGVYPYSGTPFFFLGTTSPIPAGPSMEYIFPTSSAVAYSPWNQWYLSFSNLISTHTYSVNLQWNTPELSNNSPAFSLWQNGSGKSLMHQGRGFPYVAITAFNNETTRYGWIVPTQAWLYDTTYGNFDYITTASETIYQAPTFGFHFVNDTINFYPSIATDTASTAPITGTTTSTSVIGTIYPVNNTSTEWCQAPTDWANVGSGISYAFCQAGSAFFKVDDNVLEQFNQKSQITMTRFPFVLVSQFVGTATSSLQNPTSAYSALAITIPSAMGQTTGTIDLLPTNLWSDPNANTFKETIFNIVIKFMWLCTAIGAPIIIFTP